MYIIFTKEHIFSKFYMWNSQCSFRSGIKGLVCWPSLSCSQFMTPVLFHIKFLCPARTKIQVPGTVGSLITVVKLKAKENFKILVISVFCIQRKPHINRISLLFENFSLYFKRS